MANSLQASVAYCTLTGRLYGIAAMEPEYPGHDQAADSLVVSEIRDGVRADHHACPVGTPPGTFRAAGLFPSGCIPLLRPHYLGLPPARHSGQNSSKEKVRGINEC